jgi:protocatechuate 3,4-dioxygenase, beta subunit
MERSPITRRKFISLTGAAIATGMTPIIAIGQDLQPTAKQVEGPFFPKHQQIDKDADMTSVASMSGKASGEALILKGRVLDTNGDVLANALIDIWQAESKGRYLHEDAPETSPLDQSFQYWAKIKTAEDGSYSVKTIKPAKYAAEEDWQRPPHIHFRVAKRGMRELTTHMYFANEPLNEIDKLYLEAPAEQRPSITVDVVKGEATFDIVLAKV